MVGQLEMAAACNLLGVKRASRTGRNPAVKDGHRYTPETVRQGVARVQEDIKLRKRRRRASSSVAVVLHLPLHHYLATQNVDGDGLTCQRYGVASPKLLWPPLQLGPLPGCRKWFASRLPQMVHVKHQATSRRPAAFSVPCPDDTMRVGDERERERERERETD